MKQSKYPFPKIDLHLHLDGAISPKTLMELAAERNVGPKVVSLDRFIPFVVVDPNCRSVNEYLEKFELPVGILQDGEALFRAAEELVERLDRESLAYAEIRFAPQLHTRKSMDQTDAVKAVLDGMRSGEQGRSIETNLILCAMSLGGAEANRDANLETVELAGQMRFCGVAGVDLAGAEGLCELSDFGYIFELAGELSLDYTCHAGDSQGPETVRTAISDFGSRRIGHGHHIFEDEDLCTLAKEKKAALEICLTSNIQCATRRSYAAHPAKKLLDMGLNVTLNTDNPVIAGISLESEYDIATTQAGFTEKDLVLVNINSARAAFLPEQKKLGLIKRLEAFL